MYLLNTILIFGGSMLNFVENWQTQITFQWEPLIKLYGNTQRKIKCWTINWGSDPVSDPVRWWKHTATESSKIGRNVTKRVLSASITLTVPQMFPRRCRILRYHETTVSTWGAKLEPQVFIFFICRLDRWLSPSIFFAHIVPIISALTDQLVKEKEMKQNYWRCLSF